MATLTNSICTNNAAIDVQSGTGNVNIATKASAATVTIGNITGATAVNVNTGTAGSTITTTNGIFTVATGTGAISLGADSSAKTITIGSATANDTINIGPNSAAGGTTAISIGTKTTTSVCRTDVNGGSAGVAVHAMNGGFVTINNISTTTGPVVIGSSVTSYIALAAGGASTVTMTNANFTVATGTGTLNLSNDATANAVNIATGAGAKTLTLGNVTSTTAVNINTGTAGSTITTTNGIFTVATGTGTISLGANAAAKTINIGSTTNNDIINIGLNTAVGGATTISIGDPTTTSACRLNLRAGSAGIGIQAYNGGFLTLNNLSGNTGPILMGNSTSAYLTIAAGGASTVTITNNSLTIVTGTGALNLSNDATANAVNVATGAGVKALTLGSTNTTSSVTINTGSGGITIPSFTTTGALVSTAAGVITDANASTSGYILTSNGSGSAPSFQAAPASGFTWQNVTSSTQTLAANTGYISNNGATLVTFTLPTTAAVGAEFSILGSGTGLWTIAQNAGQAIHFNGVNSTTGVTGSVSSTSQYDSITLVCNVVNAEWVVLNASGNLSVV